MVTRGQIACYNVGYYMRPEEVKVFLEHGWESIIASPAGTEQLILDVAYLRPETRHLWVQRGIDDRMAGR